MYSGYLNRQYGLSNSVAQSMVSQSMSPLKIGQLRGYMNASGARKASQVNPSALANAAMGAQTPAVLRSQDYLNNAAKLSAFNLWRAQQLYPDDWVIYGRYVYLPSSRLSPDALRAE